MNKQSFVTQRANHANTGADLNPAQGSLPLKQEAA